MPTATMTPSGYPALYRTGHRVRIEAITADGLWPRDERGRRATGNPCRFHEDNGVGEALCGVKPRPWHFAGVEYQQQFVTYPAGPVECASCANRH